VDAVHRLDEIAATHGHPNRIHGVTLVARPTRGMVRRDDPD
jgi:hypothetical protein